MKKWLGTKNADGDVSTGNDDLIQDAFENGVSKVDILQFNFIAEDDVQIQVDDNEPQWLESGYSIDFSNQYDRAKMPTINFKILNSGAKYRFLMILEHTR